MQVNSRLPGVWGPHLWALLHCFAACYPEKPTPVEQDQMLLFLTSVAAVLPCPVCRSHCLEYFKAQPPVVTSQVELMGYLWNFHNCVNKRTNKPFVKYEEAAKTWEGKTCGMESTPTPKR